MTDTNELRKLLAAATPTPWVVGQGQHFWEVVEAKPDKTPDFRARRIAFDDGSVCGEYVPSCTGPTRDLIVAAVNALPALLDELDAARAELAKQVAEGAKALNYTRDSFNTLMDRVGVPRQRLTQCSVEQLETLLDALRADRDADADVAGVE